MESPSCCKKFMDLKFVNVGMIEGKIFIFQCLTCGKIIEKQEGK